MWRLALCFAACAPAAPPAAPAPAPSLLVVRDDAFGPLTARTPATLIALRAALAGFEVTPVNAESLEFAVSQQGTPVFAIVPTEAGTILNVHVVSPAIDTLGFRVGAVLDAWPGTCECWGDQTVCFRDGAHVAVALAKPCRNHPKFVGGATVRAVIWSARPLAPGGADAAAP